DNLQKVALVGIQRGSVRQHGYRTGNGSQGITNFVGDGGSQTAHGSETILHADLAFEAADLGEIVKGINKAKIAAGTDIERRDANAKSLAEAIVRDVTDFGIAAVAAELGQRILKEMAHGASAQLRFRDLEQLLGGSIHQSDAAVKGGSDDASAHGLHDIFVERLQVFEGAACIFQLHIHLAELAHQQIRQIGNGKVSE